MSAITIVIYCKYSVTTLKRKNVAKNTKKQNAADLVLRDSGLFLVSRFDKLNERSDLQNLKLTELASLSEALAKEIECSNQNFLFLNTTNFTNIEIKEG